MILKISSQIHLNFPNKETPRSPNSISTLANKSNENAKSFENLAEHKRRNSER